MRKTIQTASQKQFVPGVSASTRLHFVQGGSQQQIQYPGYMLQGRKSQQNEQFLRKTRRFFGDQVRMQDKEQMTEASATELANH
mmetsp:Transcript_2309/g.3478  ORF Transcript_2309/g.3478 Transcript_2309/m.3478 type:complete len:84 (+) Transcript_2309:143-394(+)